MATEDRIRYLLRAADRAEGNGDVRSARALRRMANDARPAGDSEIMAMVGSVREFDF